MPHPNAKRNHIVHHREYCCWGGMKTRCFNKNSKDYVGYGGRGITVCDKWSNSFDEFFKDMGEKPTNSHQIDRIDNDGDYEPSNCRWTTLKENCRNRRSNIFLTYEGVTKTVVEWAEDLGVSRHTIAHRLRNDWDIASTVTTPAYGKRVLVGHENII